jgi:glycosyltransferase involved in cell wall biosynthesis
MKVLQVGKGWFPDEAGGLNRYYYDCIKSLAKTNVTIQSLVTGSPGQNLLDANIQVQAFASPQSSLVRRWWLIRQLVQEQFMESDYPLVVSHFALYTFPFLDQLRDRALVTHFHGPWALESQMEGSKRLATTAKKALEQAVYRRTAHFIVLSHTFCQILHQEYRIPLERIHIIPGGTDTARFDLPISQQQAREKLGWQRDASGKQRTILFCVRRLAKRMGLENLIAAIDQVRHSYPEILLCIAGKGNLASTLQAQIEALDLREHVQLLGYLPDEDLPFAYRAADLSVVPTVALEGFGLVVVESLAAGTPVLGTPIGGIAEILRPFCPDLVLEGYQTEHLAQGIKEALGDQRQLPSSQACQTYVQTNYTWDAIAPQIKAVYQMALSEQKLIS